VCTAELGIAVREECEWPFGSVRLEAAQEVIRDAPEQEDRHRVAVFERGSQIDLDVCCPVIVPIVFYTPLHRQFILFFSSKYNQSIDGLTPDAEDRLRVHSWTGNVRELRNVIERAVILTKQPRIGIEHLPLAENTDAERSGQVGELVSRETIEEAHVRRVVESTETLDRAAEVLGINPATVYRKRKDCGMTDADG